MRSIGAKPHKYLSNKRKSDIKLYSIPKVEEFHSAVYDQSIFDSNSHSISVLEDKM